MSNIFYLFGNELRKSKHDYITIAVVQSLIWIASYIVALVRYNKVYTNAMLTGVKVVSGATATEIINMGHLGITILAVSVIYAVYIWAREFISGNKSIYTIMMIPQERYKIYLVKFLNAVTMFYMNLILFIAITFIMCLIAPFIMNGGMFINPFEAMLNSHLAGEIYMPMTFKNFIKTDVLIVAANTSLISLAFLLSRFCVYKGSLAKFVSALVSIGVFVLMLFMSFVIVFEKEVIFFAIGSIVVGYFGSRYILNNLEF